MSTKSARASDSSGSLENATRPLRIHIITDLEGAAMVFHWGQTRGDSSEKHAAMRALTQQVNACIDGILDFHDKSEIVVWDGHGYGGIVYEELHQRARLIPNATTPRPYGLDRSFDALFFVGQHAMAGTSQAPLAHTYDADALETMSLNGEPVGEFGMCAYMAGMLFDVPVALIVGDDKAVGEAQSIAPHVVGITVKDGLASQSAISLTTAQACVVIRRGAFSACERVCDEISPLRFSLPYRWEATISPGHDELIERYLDIDGANRVGDRGVVLEGHDLSLIPW